MYTAMSSSRTSRASVEAGLPLPPGTSLSGIPPSSLYCTQKSVSRISAAAASRSRAASARVRGPLCSSGPSWANADEVWANRPAPTLAAPATPMPFRNERRLRCLNRRRWLFGSPDSRISWDEVEDEASSFFIFVLQFWVWGHERYSTISGRVGWAVGACVTHPSRICKIFVCGISKHAPAVSACARKMTGKIVGVISDTHGLLRPEALAALQGSDYIIHAGDVDDPAILKKLAEIAPVTAVRGNVDRGAWAKKIPETNVLEIDGLDIYVLHDLNQLDLRPEAAGFAAVISGHSHVPKQEMKNGVLYFNPGSAGPRRFKLPVSVGRLLVEAGKVRGEILQIQQ